MNGVRSHDQLQAAIWEDERRLPPGTRELALAIAWVLHTEGSLDWSRLKRLLGATEGPYARWRIHDLIAGDAPCYVNLGHDDSAGCQGPRMRPYRPRRAAWATRCQIEHHPHLDDCRYPVIHYALGEDPDDESRDSTICGNYATIRVVEHDMITGWETGRWFCSRHKERAREVKAQLAARGTPPEPIPNRGGLLPRYFAADWPSVYARGCAKSSGRWSVIDWKPPYHGVDADLWPVPGQTVIPRHPRLSIVTAAS